MVTAMRVGIAHRSANAGEVCGDLAGSWGPCGADGVAVVAIADGLGHGAPAAEAAAKAMLYISERWHDDLLDLFTGMNRVLKMTRGAAVGIAKIDLAARALTYAAVGNTRAAVFGRRATRLDGYAGIVGGGYRTLRTSGTSFHPDDTLVLWSDGVEALLDCCGDQDAEVEALANGLLTRFARGHDDQCVIVARFGPA
ncbi:MAG: SpoIIE family protein phosphatase [Azospirillaceae bacterium]|nr:SpoIIE family protein phosphatase [Azospirillaceae bacterium]